MKFVAAAVLVLVGVASSSAFVSSPTMSSNNQTTAASAFVAGCAATASVYYLMKRTKRYCSKKDDCIYLDYNGTTPIHPLVLEAMLPFFTRHFGNPSSSHFYGKEPREAIEGARRSLLALLNAPPSTPSSSIWFTGCGTEADNLAIHLALQSSPHIKQKHVVTTNVEHPAVDVFLRRLQERGEVDVTFVKVNSEGYVSATDVIQAIQPNTVLVTVMLANNESGALQPVSEIAQECRNRGILCHTDAAQAAGKVDLSSLQNMDMVTLVGHKIGAPKGVAALYVRPNCCNENQRKLPDGGIMLLGGGQEGGRRGGTENVPYIVGMGMAADLCRRELPKNALHMEAMRQRLLDNLTVKLGTEMVRPNGPRDKTKRLPNTLSVGLRGVHSGKLLDTIGNEVAASAGAACHSSGGQVSAILQAMDVPMEYAKGTLRLSVGPTTTARQIDRAVEIIARQAKLQLAEATAK